MSATAPATARPGTAPQPAPGTAPHHQGRAHDQHKRQDQGCQLASNPNPNSNFHPNPNQVQACQLASMSIAITLGYPSRLSLARTRIWVQLVSWLRSRLIQVRVSVRVRHTDTSLTKSMSGWSRWGCSYAAATFSMSRVISRVRVKVQA